MGRTLSTKRNQIRKKHRQARQEFFGWSTLFRITPIRHVNNRGWDREAKYSRKKSGNRREAVVFFRNVSVEIGKKTDMKPISTPIIDLSPFNINLLVWCTPQPIYKCSITFQSQRLLLDQLDQYPIRNRHYLTTFRSCHHSITKYQFQFDPLFGHFDDWQLVSSSRDQNFGNLVKIQT